ncbi:MAG: DNA/RNA non-specific endonuclease [Pyrinomonadaceae bacterium]
MPRLDRTVPLVFLFLLMVGMAGCGRAVERMRGDVARPEVNRAAQLQPVTADLPFGNPSNASASDRDNYLAIHDGYVLSYNEGRGTANWVAWRTTKNDLGERRERSRFEPDPTLPQGFRRIQYYDYSGSGYDRGHMVPAADRFGDQRRMEETFLMTNIVPQAGDLNQYPWNKLESYARGIVRKGNDVYTIAGVYGEKERIKGKVTVPTNCWKVIVILPRGANTINERTRIIAVDMPNIDGIEDERWERYQTTVREIEQRTGLDLFSLVPRSVQDTVETKQIIMHR